MFEWGEKKRQSNLDKHGLDFINAILRAYYEAHREGPSDGKNPVSSAK